MTVACEYGRSKKPDNVCRMESHELDVVSVVLLRMSKSNSDTSREESRDM